jgi:uncharacterized protein (UPF0261 family)
MPAYIARETAISVVINTGFSLAFFLLVFGLHTPVAVRGIGAYAFDFLPQSCAIALMSTLVPGAITAARLRKGAIARIGGSSALPRHLLPRTLVMAIIATVGGGVISALLLAMAPVAIGWWPALIAKLAYGAALAALVTPPALRAALR